MQGNQKGEELFPSKKFLSRGLHRVLLVPQSMTGQPEEASQISLQSTPGHQNLGRLKSLSYLISPFVF